MLFVIFMILPPKMGLSRLFKERFPHNHLIKVLISFFEALYLYRNAKLAIFKCLAISIFTQILMVAAVSIIANIMNFQSIPFIDYATAMGITQIVNLIPVAPGGFGVGELAFAKVLMILNPGMGGAFATVFLAYRLISILAYLPGVICGSPTMAMTSKLSS
jgi:glycosyltransferase 2 family protein